MLTPGSRVGDYEIEQELGAGGMARVYRVRHVVLETVHALKVLVPEYRVNPAARQRFLEEARIQAKHLDHPGIVKVTNIVATPEHAALVMELVDGGNLESELAALRGRPDEVKRLMLAVLDAVGHAHARGVIHRDLKPANVLLARRGDRVVPKVTDFGIAKVTAELASKGKRSTHGDSRMGTISYMSPEQIRRSKDVTPRSDIFSLGVMLYELSTGQPPFGGDSDYDVMDCVVNGRYVAPEELDPRIDPAIAAVIRRALQPDPANRFASCDEMAAALRGDAPSPSDPSNAVRPESVDRNTQGSVRPESVDRNTQGSVRPESVDRNTQPPVRPESVDRNTQPPVRPESVDRNTQRSVRPESVDRNTQRSVRPERSPERERGAESKGRAPLERTPERSATEGEAEGARSRRAAPPPPRRPRRLAIPLALVGGTVAIATTVLVVTRDPDTSAPHAHAIDAGSLSITDEPTIDAAPPPPLPALTTATRSCPAGMVLVPAGTFSMGSPDGIGDADEHPLRSITLSEFCLDRTEVTVGAYAACASCTPASLTVEWADLSPRVRGLWNKSGACNGSRADRLAHPVNCVTWGQADAYCRAVGKRLPTEAQWEYAARGTDGRTYPWGEDPPSATLANICERDCKRYLDRLGFVTHVAHDGHDGAGGTAPVGSYPDGASPFGVLDMTGNVFEWVADEFTRVHSADPVTDPPPFSTDVADARKSHTKRGSGWVTDSLPLLRLAYRSSGGATVREPETGFRCVADPR